jgi:hypothetical protein
VSESRQASIPTKVPIIAPTRGKMYIKSATYFRLNDFESIEVGIIVKKDNTAWMGLNPK